MRRDVYQAIADPTRRQIIGLLSQHTLTLNGVAAHFAVSRPAISRHIKILRQCGLISIQQQGRERFCALNLHPLQQVVEWAAQYQRLPTGSTLLLPHFGEAQVALHQP